MEKEKNKWQANSEKKCDKVVKKSLKNWKTSIKKDKISEKCEKKWQINEKVSPDNDRSDKLVKKV